MARPPHIAVPFSPSFRSGPPQDPAPARPDLPGPGPDPGSLRALVAGAGWERVWVKEGGEVWRVVRDGAVSYLKIGSAGGAAEVVAERDRLMWLDGRLSTPRVLADHVGDGVAWLLTAEVPGVPAHDPGFRMGSVQPWVQALGRELRRFHDELAVESCPFDARLPLQLASAERRVARGGVDPSILSATYKRHTAEELLEHLFATRPAEPEEDLVVAHGDPGLPNLLIDPSGDLVTGIVDLGRLGVSDRYRDLAVLVRSLVQSIGPEVTYLLLDAYGLPNPDLRRLEFYVLLDEMW